MWDRRQALQPATAHDSGRYGLKKIREWLSDYFAMVEGNEMEKILADVGERIVNSFDEARGQVNLRIDVMIAWLNGVRPASGPLSVSEEWIWDPRAYE